MTGDEADDRLKQVFALFPYCAEYMKKLDTPNETYKLWLRVLAACNAEDVDVVIEKLIAGQLSLEAYEHTKLPFILRAWAKQIEHDNRKKVLAKQESQEFAKSRRTRQDDSISRFCQRLHRSRELGMLVRDGKITKEENENELAMLLEQDRADR